MSVLKALPPALAIVVAGCATAYQMPTAQEPHAVVKYRRTYDRTAGHSLHENLTIDGHPAYRATSDAFLAESPRIDAVLVHPAPATFISSATFFHVEMRLVQETYYVSEPYTTMESYSCGFGTTFRTCTRMATHYRQVMRTRMVTRAVEVPDAACASEVRFLPAVDASYLLQLNFQEDRACTLSCFEQVPRGNGEFENRACPPAPPPPPPRRSRESTSHELH
jgi:hypothetical protein